MNNYISIISIIIIILLLRYINHTNKYLNKLMIASKKIKDNNFNIRINEDYSGKYNLIGEVISELSKRVQIEEEKNSENTSKIEVILSTVPNGLIAIDIEENIIFINDAAKDICRLNKTEIGKRIFFYLKNQELVKIIKTLIYNYKEPIRYSYGKNHYVFDIKPIIDSKDEMMIGRLINISDLTTIVNTENIRRDFVSNVTHELKTPLTAISGFVETLKSNENIPRDKQIQFLGIIEEETKRLNELIEDVLTLSFIEQNLDIKPERINLIKILSDIILKLENIAEVKCIKLKLISEEKNIFIQSNKYSLTRIFINIIDNSIKYSPEGSVVNIKVSSDDEKVRITVSDTGRGIAEEDLPRIFERFYRVDKSRTRKEKGTGLGLAIVKHLTKSIGGEIDLKSSLGEGTDFSIILPITYEKGE